MRQQTAVNEKVAVRDLCSNPCTSPKRDLEQQWILRSVDPIFVWSVAADTSMRDAAALLYNRLQLNLNTVGCFENCHRMLCCSPIAEGCVGSHKTSALGQSAWQLIR